MSLKKYDKSNRLTNTTDALNQNESYTYNANGQVITETDKAGNSTGYTYDLEGNQTSRTDGEERTETYVYDEAGRRTSLISADGKVVTYDYDELNQLIEKAYSNANGETTAESVIYGYDALGNRLAMTDGIGNAEYLYDALGRVTSVKDSADNIFIRREEQEKINESTRSNKQNEIRKFVR